MARHENMAIDGFQQPMLGPVRNSDLVSSEFVKILHTGNSHWVCISSVGCLPGHVNLCDIFYDCVLSQEVNKNDLLGGEIGSSQYYASAATKKSWIRNRCSLIMNNLQVLRLYGNSVLWTLFKDHLFHKWMDSFRRSGLM